MRPRSPDGAQKIFEILRKKNTPYESIKGDKISLNGKVTLDNEIPDSAGTTDVVCRHLAMEFLTHKGKKREMVSRFGDAQSIRDVFAGRLKQVDEDFERAIVLAPQSAKHLVHAEKFGTYLGAVASALARSAEKNAPTEANIMLLSTTHAMAVHVERKVKQGHTYFAVKVYDPESTANYKRVEADSLQDLQALKLGEMLDSQLWDEYSYSGEIFTTVNLSDHLNLTLDPLECASHHGGTQTKEKFQEKMTNAMLHDMHEAIRRMADDLVAHASTMSADEVMDLLMLKNTDAIPMYHAMMKGYAHTVSEFSELLAKLTLSDTQKGQLLQGATNPKGVSGLHVALHKGHDNVLQAFCGAMLRLNLDSETKKSLLTQRMPSTGALPLHVAVAQGRAGTIAAFGAAVKTLGLSEEQRLEIALAPLDADYGEIAIMVAFNTSKLDVIQACHDLFEQLEIPAQHVVRALQSVKENADLDDVERNFLDQIIALQNQRSGIM